MFKQLNPFLQEKLAAEKIIEPTKVQQEAIPLILAGQDVIAKSPTGTGKTLAYLLPLLQNMKEDEKQIQVLVLAPSRELVMQINGVAKTYGGKVLALIGGANIVRQIEQLKKKPQLVVATPGRILELIRMKKINLHHIAVLVLDEADRLFGSGYLEEIKGLLRMLPKEKQTLLFSASIFPTVLEAFQPYLKDPVTVNMEEKVPSGILHQYFLSKEKDKALRLRRIVTCYHPQKAVVFVNHNRAVNPLVKRFCEMDMPSLGLHSSLSELERKKVIEQFRKGKERFLVTTDLFARGMDLLDIDFVFNFDLPQNAEYYLHRVGRTGRQGKAGTAVTLVTEEQKLALKKFSRQLSIQMEEYGLIDDQVKCMMSGKKKED